MVSAPRLTVTKCWLTASNAGAARAAPEPLADLLEERPFPPADEGEGPEERDDGDRGFGGEIDEASGQRRGGRGRTEVAPHIASRAAPAATMSLAPPATMEGRRRSPPTSAAGARG